MGSFEFYPPCRGSQHEITELIVVARRLWPRIQAHAYREQPGKSSDEALAFASEVWEECCARSRKQSSAPTGETGDKGHGSLISSCFPSSVQSRSKKERRRLQTIQHLPSSRDLERLRQAHDSKAVRDLEQSIQLKEAVRNMDEWTRKVWAARQYGYS